ncbi:MAG: fluoride efflux transporter CrcB [Verrucomicrobiae bacterium]|nr:fluoride efflux transporter CrcB [Verrucomicrobiae bacterium]
MNSFLPCLWVGVGSAIGGAARFWLSGFVAHRIGETFPWGTLIVNVSGSLVIGFFAAVTAPDGRWMAPSLFRQFFMIGICGGYTTFSSFSLQTLNLVHDGDWARATANVVLSVLLCLAGVWLGDLLGARINQGHP